MGIRVVCPNGHRLHLKSFLAGRRGVCPSCAARFLIPSESSDQPQEQLPPKNKETATQFEGIDHLISPSSQQGISPTPPASSNRLPDEASQDVWYIHSPDGGQFGPATYEVIRNWIAEDRLNQDCRVWRDGWPDWQPASTILNDPLSNVHVKGPEVNAAPIESSPNARYLRKKSNGSGLTLMLVLAVIGALLLIGLIVVIQNGNLSFGPQS